MHPRATRARTLVFATLALALPLLAACGDDDPTDPQDENTAPVAAITTPATDTGTDNADFAYDGRDDDLGLWYTDVLLEGSATDAEDGALDGAALVWETDRSDLQDAELATGTSATVRLYSDQCTGTLHTVTLTATDSDGASDTAVREIWIWTLC